MGKEKRNRKEEVGVCHRCVFVFGMSPIGGVLAATGGSTLGGCGAFIRGIHLDDMSHWGAVLAFSSASWPMMIWTGFYALLMP